MTTTTAVATKTEAKPQLRTGGAVSAIVPQDAEQAWRMAQMICMSPMAPKGMEKPEHVVIAILHGLEIGLKPMQAIQSIAIVNGRPVLWGDAALGLVQGSGLVEDFEERVEGTGESMVAICRARRQGIASEIERRFSVADAKKAGLWGKSGPWSQYPQRMLQMRARSWCIRDGFPDVLKGLQVREEVHDFVAPASVEPAPVVSAAAIKAQAEKPQDNVSDAQFTETLPAEQGEEDPAEHEVLDDHWQQLARGWAEAIAGAADTAALRELEDEWAAWRAKPPVKPPELYLRQVNTLLTEAKLRLERGAKGKR